MSRFLVGFRSLDLESGHPSIYGGKEGEIRKGRETREYEEASRAIFSMVFGLVLRVIVMILEKTYIIIPNRMASECIL